MVSTIETDNQILLEKEALIKDQLISKCLCHLFDQNANKIFLRISALASKEVESKITKALYSFNHLQNNLTRDFLISF